MICLLQLNSCDLDSIKNEMRIYKDLKIKKKYKLALKSLEKIESSSKLKQDLHFSLVEQANIYLIYLNSPIEAIKAYKKLAISVESQQEKNKYQLLIARLYLENFNNYKSAIGEAKLIDLEKEDTNFKVETIKIIARSYQKLGNYYQVAIEVDSILQLPDINSEEKFILLLMQANSYQSDKQYNRAVKLFERLTKEYPTKSIQQRLYVNLIAAYESLGQLTKAIDYLKVLKKSSVNDKEFIESKIMSLQKIEENRPGAKGLRR